LPFKENREQKTKDGLTRGIGHPCHPSWAICRLYSVISHQSSVICLLFSVFCPLFSVLCFLLSVIRLLSSVLFLLLSVSCLPRRSRQAKTDHPS